MATSMSGCTNSGNVEKRKKQKLNNSQIELIVNFMETHPGIANPGENFARNETKEDRKILWGQLTEMANGVPFGSVKTVSEWEKCWRNLKYSVRQKDANYQKEMGKTGGGGSKAEPLTDLEERILQLVGKESSRGIAGAPVLPVFRLAEIHSAGELLDSVNSAADSGANDEVVNASTANEEAPITTPPRPMSQRHRKRRRMDTNSRDLCDETNALLKEQIQEIRQTRICLEEISGTLKVIAQSLQAFSPENFAYVLPSNCTEET